MTASNNENSSTPEKAAEATRTQPKNPLHGVTLEAILNDLVAITAGNNSGGRSRSAASRTIRASPPASSFCAAPRGHVNGWSLCTFTCCGAKPDPCNWCNAPQVIAVVRPTGKYS